jgi:hypothetical protein
MKLGQQNILVFFAILVGLVGTSCDDSGANLNTELDLSDSLRPAVLINEVAPDAILCQGLERYIESNEAYLETLRNYESYSDATRDSLQNEALIADDNLQEMKDEMSLSCLDRYRVQSVEFTREMLSIIVSERPI